MLPMTQSMKSFFGVLLFFACFLPAVCGQKTRPGQLPSARPGVTYPVKVHISGVRVRRGAEGSCTAVYADASIEGKKIELMGCEVAYPTYKRFNVLPGDYDARILKDPQKVNGTSLYREYELVLPDKVNWQCTVTGIFE